MKARNFSFQDTSRYRALEFGGNQYQAILGYERDTSVPVHYLLYNPLRLPLSVTYPIEAGQLQFHDTTARIGARVISASSLDMKLTQERVVSSDNPAFNQIFEAASSEQTPPWSLEYFIADLVLSCKEGHVAGVNPMEDEALFTVFNRRSGPISAAIAITIDAPTEAAAQRVGQ